MIKVPKNGKFGLYRANSENTIFFLDGKTSNQYNKQCYFSMVYCAEPDKPRK